MFQFEAAEWELKVTGNPSAKFGVHAAGRLLEQKPKPVQVRYLYRP